MLGETKKKQQDEAERQAWIKANPDKYTRLPGPGEGPAAARERPETPWRNHAIPRRVEKRGAARDNERKILAVLKEHGKPSLTLTQLSELSGFSYSVVCHHMRDCPHVVFEMSSKDRAKHYRLKEEADDE